MVELGGMVAVAIGWEPDGDLGGYGQPLDDAAVLVVRDTNNHGGLPPFQIGFSRNNEREDHRQWQGCADCSRTSQSGRAQSG